MPIDVARMSSSDKVAEAMRRSLPLVPASARRVIESMLSPEAIATIAATLGLWAGSHAFGVGEVVDLILLGVGVLTLGFAVFEGADALYAFATTAVNAGTETELDRAARHFARAVVLLGISALQAVLLRGQGRAAVARGRPRVQALPEVGSPPTSTNRLVLSRPSSLAGGGLGSTDAYGAIAVARDQSLTEQRLTLLHELVHRFFSPRTGPLRQLRAELNMSAYSRSALLRYLEEALAEGYAQLRVNGLARALAAYRFPLQGGYVTLARLGLEGAAVGTIVLGAQLFVVSVSNRPMVARR